MALFLRDEEVNQAVNMDEMLAAIENMQRHYGQGEVMNLDAARLSPRAECSPSWAAASSTTASLASRPTP